MRVRRAYGINTQNRSMYPCSKEVSQTVAVCHGVATIACYGFNYLAGAKSQKPWIKDCAMALKASRQDGCVCFKRKPKIIAFAQNTRDEVRILGEDGNVAGCVAAQAGMKQQTYLCIRRRRKILNKNLGGVR